MYLKAEMILKNRVYQLKLLGYCFLHMHSRNGIKKCESLEAVNSILQIWF